MCMYNCYTAIYNEWLNMQVRHKLKTKVKFKPGDIEQLSMTVSRRGLQQIEFVLKYEE